jgi:hypothetical protein
MNVNIAHRIARCVAPPVVAVGISCGAILGLAGSASAATVNSQDRHYPSLLEASAAANFTAPEV